MSDKIRPEDNSGNSEERRPAAPSSVKEGQTPPSTAEEQTLPEPQTPVSAAPSVKEGQTTAAVLFCQQCGLAVKPDMKNCPVCGRYAGGDGRGITAYVDNPSGLVRRRSRGLDIAVNVTVLFMLLSAVANAAYFIISKSFNYRLLFSVYAVLFGSIALFSVLLPIRRRRFKWKEAAATYVLLTLSFVAADLLTDLKIDFSIAYAAPSIALATAVAAAVVALVRRKMDLSNPLLMMLISVALLIVLTALVTSLYYCGPLMEITLVPVWAELAAGAALLTFMLLTRFKEHIKNLVKKFHV